MLSLMFDGSFSVLGEATPDSYLNEFEATLLDDSTSGSATEDETVGYIRGYYINVQGAKAAGEDVYSVFDMEEDTEGFYPYLYNEFREVNDLVTHLPESFNEDSNVLVITHVRVNPKLRGQNIGLKMIQHVMREKGMGADVCVLRAHPLTTQCSEDADKDNQEEVDNAIIKLLTYYEDLFFREIVIGKGYMITDISNGKVPEIV